MYNKSVELENDVELRESALLLGDFSVQQPAKEMGSMKKTAMTSLLIVALVGVGLSSFADHHEGSWTGEVVDLACYVANGAKGADHEGCAKSCVKNGQPMGLLTDDGTLVLLAADHKDGGAYESLKDLAGEKADVMGSLAEKDGMKIVTVTGSKAAS